MKTVQVIEFENLNIIANKVWDIICPHIVDFNYLYHLDPITDTDRFKQIPELAEQMQRLGLLEYWNWTAVVVLYDQEPMPIHVDNYQGFYPYGMGGAYSLNIPIRNTKNTYTVFYKPKPGQSSQRFYIPETAIDYFGYEPDQVEEIERVELTKPMLFNVSVPHNVVVESKQLPRVAIALRLNKNFQGQFL